MGMISFLKRTIFGKRTVELAGIQNPSTEQESSNGETDSDRDVRETQTAILSFTLFGLFALVLFTLTSISPSSWVARARLTGIGLLYAGAFFGVGALAGFLFGIPRSLQGKSRSNKDKPADSSEPAQTKYAANTNLEEISDWLTKIIVGLGLVNLKNVPDFLKKAA